MDWFLHDGDPHREKLKTLTILSNQLILDAWLGPARVSAD